MIWGLNFLLVSHFSIDIHSQGVVAWALQVLSFCLRKDWISLHQNYVRNIGHTLEHIVTKIHCDHTYIEGDIWHQPQGNRRKAVCFNITRRGPKMALDNISCLFQKMASLPNYFLEWIYFTYSSPPDGKIWLRWCLGVKAYKASTISKLACFSECLLFQRYGFARYTFSRFFTTYRLRLPILNKCWMHLHVLSYIDSKFDLQYILS